MKFLIRKLLRGRIWARIFYERLTEPLHLNALSLLVFLVGSYRQRISFDLVVRQQHAFGILKCADMAKGLGIETVSLIEFGVATGAGILNIAEIANKVTKATGVRFHIYGFDTGKGMPPALDYRDHPDLYQEGDFEMNVDALKRNLPDNVTLLVGDVKESVDHFIKGLSPEEPVGFISVDLDFYHSTKDCLRVAGDRDAQKYLPIVVMYLDDISLDPHNQWCGELLAINEFNETSPMRKIDRPVFLENARVFKRAKWIKQIFYLHVLDHHTRSSTEVKSPRRSLENPYLSFKGNKEEGLRG